MPMWFEGWLLDYQYEVRESPHDSLACRDPAYPCRRGFGISITCKPVVVALCPIQLLADQKRAMRRLQYWQW